MALRIVRLGSPRAAHEGLRIGTVRRPPRGVPKQEYKTRDFYDVWFPNLAPSEALLKKGRSASDERAWRNFVRSFEAELRAPDRMRELDLLAALSHSSSFAIGCYCPDESRCHVGVLRRLLEARGALFAE